MSSAYVLILCTLLLQSEGNVPPRQPAVQPTPFSVTMPIPVAPPPVVVPPPMAPKQLTFRNAVLVLPRHNEATLSASSPDKLTSLNTEQRDVAGNIVRDSENNPIMIPVREGMNVFKGQVLGHFDDSELRSTLKINQAELEVAKAERDNDIEKEHAARGVQVAYVELEMKNLLNKEIARTVPEIEIQRARYALAQAEANMELQKYYINELKTRAVIVQETRLEETEVKIEKRQLTAPIGGMVVEINAAEGEWLGVGTPVLKIVQLDTLWVRVQVNAKEYNHSDFADKQAVIQVAFANGRVETFQGAVVFCDPIVKAGSYTFDVNIEVQNRKVGNFWLLHPGLDGVDIVIPL